MINRAAVYDVFGRLLFSTGIVIGGFLGLRLVRETVDGRIDRMPATLLLAGTPAFSLPAATSLPTSTPLPTLTPSPTPTPVPLPPIRIAIPDIGLNASIEEITPTEKKSASGDPVFVWEPLSYAVAHYDSSAKPGQAGNIVLAGHNNTLGEVFRYLHDLEQGDEVILYTETGEFHYRVQSSLVIPYLGAEEEGDALLQSFAAPQSTEKLTLISCWPYATNANRIVVIAVPY